MNPLQVYEIFNIYNIVTCHTFVQKYGRANIKRASMHIVYDMRHMHHHQHDFQRQSSGLCNYPLEIKTWHVLIWYLQSPFAHHLNQFPIMISISIMTQISESKSDPTIFLS